MAATRRILVIDHSPEGRTRIVEPLRAAGFEVAVAASAADGAASFGRFDPHLVFIAARLPRTHGTVLCRELKRTAAGDSSKIVLVVEAAEVQIDLPPLDQFGADHLLRVPIGTDEIMRVVHSLLPQDAATSDQAPNPEKYGLAELEENDDGLSNALEELDTLDFDLPAELPESPAKPNADPAVPLSDDRGEDIQDHLDDLFDEAPKDPKPVLGQDAEIDEVFQDELGAQAGRSTTQAATPAVQPEQAQQPPASAERRAVAPRTPSMSTAPATTRYQTAALTEKKTETKKATPVVEPSPRAPIGRWSLAAVSATVIVVALAAAWGTRSGNSSQPAAGDSFAATPLASQENETPQSRDAVSAQLMGPPIGSQLTSPESSIDTAAEPTSPLQEPAIEPTAKPNVKPTVEAQPEKQIAQRRQRPEPAQTEPKTEQTPSAQPVSVRHEPDPPKPVRVEATQPEPANDLEPEAKPEPANAAQPESVTTESSQPSPEEKVAVDREPLPEGSAETTAAPTLNFEIERPELEPREAVEVTAEPSTPVIEPITRDAVLLQRVEPRVSAKDLKKGRGKILLKVLVTERGNVSRVLVEQGLPGSPVEAAAVAAVLRWRYEPALERDVPVESWVRAEFNFP